MKHLDRRHFGFYGLLAGTVALGGCSAASLLPKPPAPAARYTLDDGAMQAPSAAAAGAAPRPGAPVLLVVQTTAAPGFDGTRMVYLRRPQQLESFAFHEWVEPPARLLAPLLLRHLQGTGAFRAVLLAPTVAVASLRLETELIRLQQDFTVQPSQLRLTLRAVLLDSARREVVFAQTFDESLATAGDDPLAGVVAAQRLTQRVLAALAAQAGQAAAGRPQRASGGAATR
jgi:cholesterol transport system auxiliary component